MWTSATFLGWLQGGKWGRSVQCWRWRLIVSWNKLGFEGSYFRSNYHNGPYGGGQGWLPWQAVSRRRQGWTAVSSYSRWSHWPLSPFLFFLLLHSPAFTLYPSLTFLLILEHMTSVPTMGPLVSLFLSRECSPKSSHDSIFCYSGLSYHVSATWAHLNQSFKWRK